MGSLYDISERYKNLLEIIDNPDIPKEMMEQVLNEVEEEFKIKAENIVKFMKNIEADIEGIKAEEERLANRRKSLGNKKDNLKEYLYQQMIATNIKKFKTPLFSFGIQNNPPSVEITDESKLDKKYLIAQPSKVDTKGILNDLKAGLQIEGAKIKQGESLRIR